MKMFKIREDSAQPCPPSFPLPRGRERSKETDSMNPGDNDVRNYAGFLHWNQQSPPPPHLKTEHTAADNRTLKWGRRVLTLDQAQFGGLSMISEPNSTAQNGPEAYHCGGAPSNPKPKRTECPREEQ